MMDVLPAGLEPPSAPPLWHHGFLQAPDLPEILVAGRERPFLTYFFRHAYDPTTFADAVIDRYVAAFAAPGGIRGAASHLRAIPVSADQNRRLSQRKLAMPVLAIGAAASYGGGMAAGARLCAENVSAAVPERCGYWIPEERPVWLAKELIAFLGNDRQ
jgi:hypothetical protein